MTKAQYLEIIYKILSRYNQESGQKIPLKSSTPLWGGKGYLDSLTLARFIVELEEVIEEKYHQSLMLATEKNLSKETTPFKTADTLATYLEQTVEKKNA